MLKDVPLCSLFFSFGQGLSLTLMLSAKTYRLVIEKPEILLLPLPSLTMLFFLCCYWNYEIWFSRLQGKHFIEWPPPHPLQFKKGSIIFDIYFIWKVKTLILQKISRSHSIWRKCSISVHWFEIDINCKENIPCLLLETAVIGENDLCLCRKIFDNFKLKQKFFIPGEKKICKDLKWYFNSRVLYVSVITNVLTWNIFLPVSCRLILNS